MARKVIAAESKLMTTRYLIEMKRIDFYLKVPPLYRNEGVEKWTDDVKLAYKFEDRFEAEEVLNALPNNRNMRIRSVKEKEEKPVVLTGNKNKKHKDYNVTMKYIDYEISMTFTNITEENAVDKAVSESANGSKPVKKSLVLATLKPK